MQRGKELLAGGASGRKRKEKKEEEDRVLPKAISRTAPRMLLLSDFLAVKQLKLIRVILFV